MLFLDAQQRLRQLLAPLSLEEFLDQTLSGGVLRVAGPGGAARSALLGTDPRALLGAAVQLAPKLTFHSANPLGPPPSLEGLTDAAEFRERIEAFHARNYSVRFPELRPLSPPLDEVARALEILLLQPVTTSAFWSRGGMRAPVHWDDHDLIVVQLLGEKRWYVQSTPSELPNTWRGIPPDSVELGPHEAFDVQPGDLVYLPRGTLHSVDSQAESLHVSIGFTPLTVREALLAALDQLADVDRTLRTTVGARLAFQLRGLGLERLGPPVLDAAERLRTALHTPGFLGAALQRRSSRVVATLAPLPVKEHAPIGLDTELTQGALALCQLTANPEKIDFSHPGGHIYIHRGVEQSLLFMVNTPRFRVRDIPGEISDEVRLSLAGRLVATGFLEPA